LDRLGSCNGEQPDERSAHGKCDAASRLCREKTRAPQGVLEGSRQHSRNERCDEQQGELSKQAKIVPKNQWD
jgi:hypothetical protein